MFENKVAVVTGGTKGIGKTIAEEFRKAGATVCSIDLLPNDYYVGDLADQAVLEDFARKVITDYGHVDYLINNALPLMKDVYKRQVDAQGGITGSGRVYGKSSPALEFVTEEYYRSMWSRWNTQEQLDSMVAVSYTHLDVYKRQVQRISGTSLWVDLAWEYRYLLPPAHGYPGHCPSNREEKSGTA